MKILNPHYTPEIPQKRQAVFDELAAFFQANRGIDGVTFEQVRTRLGKTDKELPDGEIAQAVQDAGYKVEA